LPGAAPPASPLPAAMEAIKRIVQEIGFMCRVRGVVVSDTLGAFMARAVVLENAAQFPLDKELNEADVQDLIKMSTEKLLEQNSPALETVKMQVGFDTARVQETEELDRTRAQSEQREGALVGEISNTRLKPGNDVEALTALYRKIFNFLVVRAGIDPGSDKPAEREIAAALESVFPRIGLKAFTALSHDDKAAQLLELANIVLGIRLFNRHIGKGGAGIVDLPRSTAELSASLITETSEEIDRVEELCGQYGDVIAQKYRGDDKTKPTRLQQELANRRQYLAYLKQLEASFRQAASHAEQLTRMLLNEMEALKELVGSRTSVPKEQVYPRFDSLAKLWASFDEEHSLLRTRCGTLQALQTFRASYTPTLKADDLLASRSRAALRNDDPDSGDPMLPPDASAAAAVVSAGGEGGAMGERLMDSELREAQHVRLELDGYCATTIAERDGLLLQGSPQLLVRHSGRYYAFLDEPSLDKFQKAPEQYVRGVLATAKRMPELIHMLRLQEHFPAASISEIMRQHASSGSAGSLLAPAKSFQDSTAQTPTHFVEKNIDMQYEWNEWALRRRALQLANLRQKKTTSQQTTQSALRREAETQVYLPAEQTTQTGVSTGTAPPISRNYIAGLRGAPDSVMSLVNLTYDPECVIGTSR